MLLFILAKTVCLYTFAVRVAHPLANWRAGGAVFWKDAWHLAPSPWLLASSWHRYVSFPRCRSEKLSVWQSNVITYDLVFTNCEERYKTPRSYLALLFEEVYEAPVLHLFSLTGNLSQSRLCSLAGHSEWPTLRYSERALQDWDA